jgi:DNA-binding CsgD family transcriptional regulator
MPTEHTTDPGELTPREQEVLGLAESGMTNKEIALKLGVTRNAVRFHLKEIHSKLATGGERRRLGGGWGRALGFGLPVTKLGTAFTALSLVGGVALTGFAAYQAYPGADSANADSPPLVDGLYPNGCPPEFSAGTMRLADFAHGSTRIDDLRALNPGLSEGWLPPETIVKVPYDPAGQCVRAGMTPVGASATGTPGGTPQAATAASGGAGLIQPTPPASNGDVPAFHGGTPLARPAGSGL